MPSPEELAHIIPDLRPLAVPIASLRGMSRNPRTHGERNLDAIGRSIAGFRQCKPVVVAEDGVTVIAGNGTLEAMRRAGWEWIAVVRSELGNDRATQFAVADNRSAELAGWDNDVVGEVLRGFDEVARGLMGFDPADEDFLSYFTPAAAGDLPAQPAPPPNPDAAHFTAVSEAHAGAPATVPEYTGVGGTPVAGTDFISIVVTGPRAVIESIRSRTDALRQRWGFDTLYQTIDRALSHVPEEPLP